MIAAWSLWPCAEWTEEWGVRLKCFTRAWAPGAVSRRRPDDVNRHEVWLCTAQCPRKERQPARKHARPHARKSNPAHPAVTTRSLVQHALQRFLQLARLIGLDHDVAPAIKLAVNIHLGEPGRSGCVLRWWRWW